MVCRMLLIIKAYEPIRSGIDNTICNLQKRPIPIIPNHLIICSSELNKVGKDIQTKQVDIFKCENSNEYKK